MTEVQSLTARQKQFLALTARGFQYAQIAHACGVSIKTIENQLSMARKRIGATTTAQCVVIAIAREELGIDHDGNCYVAAYGE